MNSKNDYLEVVYNTEDRPLTEYPNKLTKHLFEIFNLKKDQKIIDIGCGRGGESLQMDLFCVAWRVMR